MRSPNVTGFKRVSAGFRLYSAAAGRVFAVNRRLPTPFGILNHVYSEHLKGAFLYNKAPTNSTAKIHFDLIYWVLRRPVANIWTRLLP